MAGAPGSVHTEGVARVAVALLIVAPAVALACGTRSDLPELPSACERGGGIWTSLGCNGAADRCGPIACVDVSGPGCSCGDGRCWDGTACVPDPALPIDADGCYETCAEPATFRCVSSCLEAPGVAPVCIAGAWTCPPHEGRFPQGLCDQPHPQGECGGGEQLACPEGFYCDYGQADDGTCGRSGQLGTCLESPVSCEFYREPVCTCGGWENSNPGCGTSDPPFAPGAAYGVCEDLAATGTRCGMWTECGPDDICVRTPTGLAGVFEYACEDPTFDPEEGCEGAVSHPCGASCADLGSMVMLTCDCSD